MAGRRLPWWLIGVSIIATAFSSISLLGWTGKGYTHDTMVLLSLTQYIRNLGYEAHATMNDSSLAIPLAVPF